MTPTQFTALMKVSGIKPQTGTYTAMQCIFIDGKTARDAAKEAELSPSTVCNAKNKVLNVYASLSGRINLLQEAFGDGSLLRGGV